MQSFPNFFNFGDFSPMHFFFFFRVIPIDIVFLLSAPLNSSPVYPCLSKATELAIRYLVQISGELK